MPPFRFTAEIAYDYAGTRDTKGILLGTVQPGDVGDLDEAPDRWWYPVEDGQGEPAGESGAPEGDAPEPAADLAGPVPAPPAVIAAP